MTDESHYRANDEIIYQMARDIGQIKGTVDSFLESQKLFNKVITEKLVPRVESLEESRTKGKYTILGAAGVASATTAGLHGMVTKFLGWF